MKKRSLIFLLLFALALGGVVWLAPRLLGASAVAVAKPVRGPAVQAVYATGTVEATVMMPIAPRVAARLVELSADEGSEVTKGQTLARLEDDDLKGGLKQLEAQETLARTEFERNETLLGQSAISQSEYDRAKSAWESARAAVARARAELGFMRLQAPAEGRIIRRDGEVGQLIAANQPVFWLSCCAPLRISAEVDEEDIALVRPGQKVLIRADAFPGEVFEGRVQAITPKGDPIARSYRVRIEFSEKTPLLIGMTAENNIVARETKDALLVPSTAVSEGRVWVVENGRLARRKVGVGARGPEQTEIESGVAEGDLVVVRPDASLKEGAPARAVPVAAPKPGA